MDAVDVAEGSRTLLELSSSVCGRVLSWEEFEVRAAGSSSSSAGLGGGPLPSPVVVGYVGHAFPTSPSVFTAMYDDSGGGEFSVGDWEVGDGEVRQVGMVVVGGGVRRRRRGDDQQREGEEDVLIKVDRGRVVWVWCSCGGSGSVFYCGHVVAVGLARMSGGGSGGRGSSSIRVNVPISETLGELGREELQELVQLLLLVEDAAGGRMRSRGGGNKRLLLLREVQGIAEQIQQRKESRGAPDVTISWGGGASEEEGSEWRSRVVEALVRETAAAATAAVCVSEQRGKVFRGLLRKGVRMLSVGELVEDGEWLLREVLAAGEMMMMGRRGASASSWCCRRGECPVGEELQGLLRIFSSEGGGGNGGRRSSSLSCYRLSVYGDGVGAVRAGLAFLDELRRGRSSDDELFDDDDLICGGGSRVGVVLLNEGRAVEAFEVAVRCFMNFSCSKVSTSVRKLLRGEDNLVGVIRGATSDLEEFSSAEEKKKKEDVVGGVVLECAEWVCSRSHEQMLFPFCELGRVLIDLQQQRGDLQRGAAAVVVAAVKLICCPVVVGDDEAAAGVVQQQLEGRRVGLLEALLENSSDSSVSVDENNNEDGDGGLLEEVMEGSAVDQLLSVRGLLGMGRRLLQAAAAPGGGVDDRGRRRMMCLELGVWLLRRTLTGGDSRLRGEVVLFVLGMMDGSDVVCRRLLEQQRWEELWRPGEVVGVVAARVISQCGRGGGGDDWMRLMVRGVAMEVIERGGGGADDDDAVVMMSALGVLEEVCSGDSGDDDDVIGRAVGVIVAARGGGGGVEVMRYLRVRGLLSE